VRVSDARCRARCQARGSIRVRVSEAVSGRGVRRASVRHVRGTGVRHVGVGREAVAGRMSEAWVSGGRRC
jgi:hypothetical protein